MVAAPLLDSSSGWACTHTKRSCSAPVTGSTTLMSPMTTPPAVRRPPGRYDEPRQLSRPVLLAGAALLVAVLLGLSYLGRRHYDAARTPFSNLGYTVSDTGVVLRFQVVKDAGKTV